MLEWVWVNTRLKLDIKLSFRGRVKLSFRGCVNVLLREMRGQGWVNLSTNRGCKL